MYYWIAYIVLGAAVGLIVGWIYGHKAGYLEGWDGCAALQREAHQLRGQKAAATRRSKATL